MKKKSKEHPTPKYDSKREQNVLLEKISSDVERVAEGHDVLDRKLDQANAKLEEHDKRFDRLEMVVSAHTKDIKEIKTGLDRIEQKLDTATTDHEQRLQKLEAV